MRQKHVVSLVGIVSVVALGALYGSALAYGRGGEHGGGDRDLWLLARAAGLSTSQIGSAFKNDSSLQTDRVDLRTARDTLNSCLISGQSCASQTSAYASALQALAQERMKVWGTLFQSAPNLTQAATVLGELQQQQAQRKQIAQQVFGTTANDTGSTSDGGSS